MSANIILVLVGTILAAQKVSTFGEAAGSVVKNLPGFPGPLPFHLETGYIGVDESEDVQFFYYFTKSESDPESDPLLLWLVGGPGCSVISDFAYGIGPIHFEPFEYDGSLPNVRLNPYSWNKVASVVFLDQPVETGFSYARTAKASHSSDFQVSHQIYEFLRKWLLEHPEFISNSVYVGGSSYAGFIVPLVTQLISDGNKDGIEPKIALKGYLAGNPVTRPDYIDLRVPYAHGVGLISDELYQSLKIHCKGHYQIVDPSNAICGESLQIYNKLLSGINFDYILDRVCPPDSPEPTEKSGDRIEMFTQKIQGRTPTKCLDEHLTLVDHWANDETVQEALHIRKGSIGKWIRCNRNLSYDNDALQSVVPYYASLSAEGYRSLVYSGDHDMVVPHIDTQAWIKSLNYPIIDDWRQWIVGGQVAGYARTYANGMTFATVKGAGHTAPTYRPKECLAMFKRWISSQPL